MITNFKRFDFLSIRCRPYAIFFFCCHAPRLGHHHRRRRCGKHRRLYCGRRRRSGTAARTGRCRRRHDGHLGRYGVDSRQPQACGREDRLDRARSYLRHAASDANGQRMEAYLRHGDKALHYLEDHTRLRLRLRPAVVTCPDYYPDLPGVTLGGRVFEPEPLEGNASAAPAPCTQSAGVRGGLQEDCRSINGSWACRRLRSPGPTPRPPPRGSGPGPAARHGCAPRVAGFRGRCGRAPRGSGSGCRGA